MSKLEKSIRSKRYTVKSEKKVTFTFDTPTGEQFKVEVVDCSSNGVRCRLETSANADETWTVGDIFPTAKLTWDKGESFLGRMVLRRLHKGEKHWDVAFSTVDAKVPVTGTLSHCLDIKLAKEDFGHPSELNSNRFSLAHFVENEFHNVDLFERVRQYGIFHRDWESSKKYGYNTVREASKGPRVNLTRVRKNGRKDYIIMGSNDYLGLGAHPEVVDAAKKALDLYGFGSTGSPVSTGTTDLHIELSAKVARIHQKEAALLFNSGYAANVGIITSLTTTNDLIIADQLCHASIQDAMQMSKATSRFFKHNNAEHLEALLQKERENYNGCLVITEGVFSMDGDVAKLDEIFRIARKYNCRIMVDQAHCFGVLGNNGLGVCEKFNVLKEVDIIMGTFSKICGGIGGFAVGSQELVDWIRHFGRAQIFTVSLPPSTCAAVSKSLDVFQQDKSLLQNLHRNIQHFVRGLESLGYKFAHTQESAVIPVVVGDEEKLGEMYQSLLDDGILCIPVIYPAVGRKNCRFRFTIMATHSLAELDYAVTCLEKAMIKANFSFQAESAELDKKSA